MTTESDAWGAFGSDDEDEEGDAEMAEENLAPASEAALFLTKSFLHDNSKVSIAQRRIGIFAQDNDDPKNNGGGAQAWSDTLTRRGFGTATVLAAGDNVNHNNKRVWYDAVVILISATAELQVVRELQDKAHDSLVPGGFLLVAHSTTTTRYSSTNATLEIGSLLHMDSAKWSKRSPSSDNSSNISNNNGKQEKDLMEVIFQSNDTCVVVLQKRLCQIQERSCLWLSSKHSIAKERQRAEEATVAMSAHEIESGQMTEPSIVKAVEKMKDHGYCIIPRLLNPIESLEWGQAVLSDLHSASKILVEREGVDIFHPHSSKEDPQSYRELSMREDLRMDLRDGPRMRQLRGRGGGENSCNNNNKPIVLKGSQIEPEDTSATNASATGTTNNGQSPAANPFFRQNPSMLEVVRRTMNPKVGTLYKGNFGRYNFSGGGPDGSFQDLRLSAVGGIVSLPRSADQALHADTPHLFEHATLPAHYINAFTPGCQGDSLVGCTAFVNGSHKIEFTAQYLAEDTGNDNGTNGNNSQHPSSSASGDNHDAVFHFLARPQLELGDLVLFDCRILHFGLANMSKTVERPLLYCNMTHAWFTDPKNWADHHPIFEDL